MNAASQGHSAMVKLLLSAGADPTLKNKYQETAFDLAAQGEHAFTCSILQRAESQWVRNQYLNRPSMSYYTHF